MKKSRNHNSYETFFLVRVSRFELEASWTPFKRDTKLRHTRIFCCAVQVSLDRIAHSSTKCKTYFEFFSKNSFFFLLTKWDQHGIILSASGVRTGLSHTERWLSGRKHRSWKPAMWKNPWVRIPLSPPKFHMCRSTQVAEGAPLLRE